MIRQLGLVAVLLGAFAARWRGIEQVPFGLEGDEFAWTVTAMAHAHGVSVEQLGMWSLHDTNAQSFPVSVFLDQLAFRLFGADFISPRKLLVILSVASLFFFHRFALRFVGAGAALGATAAFAFSPFALIASRIPAPPPFSDILVYPGLIAATASGMRGARGVVLALVAGAALTGSTLTYNLSYLMPIVGAATIVWAGYGAGGSAARLPVKAILLRVLAFVAPLAAAAPIWVPGLLGGFGTRDYALDHSTFDLATRSLRPERFLENVVTVGEMLFVGLRFETSDMIIRYSAPLVHGFVGAAAVVGVATALARPRRAAPLLFWLLGSAIPYHLVLGLDLARMWCVTIGLLFLFAALAVDAVGETLARRGAPRELRFGAAALALIALAWVGISGWNTYRSEALHNVSFSPWHREIAELAAAHPLKRDGRIVWVLGDSLGASAAFAARAFHTIDANPGVAPKIRVTDRRRFGIASFEELAQMRPDAWMRIETFVADARSAPAVERLAGGAGLCLDSKQLAEHLRELVRRPCSSAERAT